MSKKTLFEELNEEVNLEGKGKSPFFYRRAFARLSEKYKNDPQRIILDEQKDNGSKEETDKNVLRRIPKVGHLMMFEYEASSKNLKYFDKNPLVYIISTSGNSFTGSNLHYIDPPKRQIITENLMDGRLNLPYSSVSKYNINQIKGLLLDVAFDEWITAINIPIESFVSIKEGIEKSILVTDVWKDTNKTFKKMLRGVRTYKGYGKNDLDFRGN
jgi:hypothetical protein